MRTILVLGIILFNFTSLLAQRQLLNQTYASIAEDFNLKATQLEDYRSRGKIEIFNEEKHKTKLAKKLLSTKSGKTRIFKSDYYQTRYEVVSRQEIPHYRIRYIYIDSEKFETVKALNSYVAKVRKLLKETPFKSVAMQYSMDRRKHVGGDSGWFKKGQAHSVFFNQVTDTNRLSEEVFEFEIPEYNGYYFAQKLWSAKDIKEVLVVYNIEKK